ncbi:MAG: patatin, partial [Verrucomicrobiota bacterium]|nr:patatin [Verrucomicrobiota bacterium]
DKVGRIADIGPKYSTNGKIAGLRAILNAAPTPIADVPLINVPAQIGLPGTQFLIVGFDYDLLRARFFRSDASSPAGTFSPPDTATTLALAAHASSNAPVNYFDEPAKFSDSQFWDGAIAGYNNPVLAGVLELLAHGVARDTIDALSLGTANVALPSAGPATDPCLIQEPRTASFPRVKDDILVLATSVVDDPPDAASFHAHLALTQRLPAAPDQPIADGPIVRLNPLVRPVRDAQGAWIPPQLNPGAPQNDLGDLKALATLDMDATADSDIALIQKLADAWINDRVPNQPIRWRRNDDPGCEIGHACFSAARAAWLARCP